MRLIADNLGCVRGGRRIFSGLSFSLNAGELLLVTGRNGSGKSSLLRMIAGFLPCDEGWFKLEGGTVVQNNQPLHYLGHTNGLHTRLTVNENLGFTGALMGGGDLIRALDFFDLNAISDDQVRYLSAGQRRRTALSRLLLVSRPCWILDEPETGLDRENLQRMERLIQSHCQEGGIVVISTHNKLELNETFVLNMDGG